MKRKVLIVLALWLVPLGSGFAQEKEIRPDVRAFEHADKYAKFKRQRELFHNKADKELKVQRLVDQEAEDAEEVGQINVKF